MRQEQVQAVADEIGGRLMTCVEQEHAVLRELRLRQLVVAEQAREQIVVAARMPAPLRDQLSQIGAEFRHRAIAGLELRGASSAGSSAPRIASDQPRSGPRSSRGTRNRLPITSTGTAAA